MAEKEFVDFISSELTDEGNQAVIDSNIAIANDYARAMHYNNIQEMNEEAINAISDTTSYAAATVAREVAAKTVKDLLLLTLQQEVINPPEVAYMNIIDKFEAGAITEGNNREYIYNIATGSDTYDRTLFIPSKITDPKIQTWNLNLYERDDDGNVVLAENTYQFKKPFTILEQEWMPYFMSGRLQEFLSKYRNLLRKTYRIFKFQKIMEKLLSINPYTITGSASNMYNAFSKEIIPEMAKMGTYKNIYNADTNEDNPRNLIMATPFSKLNLLLSETNKVTVQTGIMSQLFNVQFFNKGGLLTNGRIHTLGNMLVVGDSDTAIQASETPFVDENTVWVFNDDLIKHVYQIQRFESQFFAENLSLQLTAHIWGTFGVLPWGQVFKYTNSNLSVLPSEE